MQKKGAPVRSAVRCRQSPCLDGIVLAVGFDMAGGLDGVACLES